MSPLRRTTTKLRWHATFSLLALVATFTSTSGCYFMKRARVPMRTVAQRRDPERVAPCLLVMLPGMGDSASDFESHGFFEAVQRSGIEADVVAVDAHFKYYKRQTLIDRLHYDVLAPARSEGYRRIVLVGISMGGLGAVSTAREHPEDVDALALLAPYLGDADMVRSVRSQGLASYRPSDPDEFFQRNWAYLGGYARGEARPPVALGWGSRDRLAPALELLRPFLPESRVRAVDGVHAWRTWTPIFDEWARDGTLAALCTPAAASPPTVTAETAP